jgi:hypothetical protein
MQAGYDHSDHFIASFIGEHRAFHAQAMAREPPAVRPASPRIKQEQFMSG